MPARVHQETRLRLAPPLRRLLDGTRRDAGHLGRPGQRPLPAVLGDFLETDCLLLDEVAVHPPLVDHDRQHAGEQGPHRGPA